MNRPPSGERPHLASIHDMLADLGPGVRKADRSVRERGEEQASAAFRRAFTALDMPVLALARYLGVHHSTVQGWLQGNKVPPAWVIGALPYPGRVAMLRELVAFVPREERESA